MKSNNQDHNNKNQGCGSQILSSSSSTSTSSSSSTSSISSTAATTTNVLNNFIKNSTTTSTLKPPITSSSLLSIQNSNLVKPLPKTVISSSSAAASATATAAAAAALSMNSTITSSSLSSATASTAAAVASPPTTTTTTILNGVQTSITQLGTPLPSALQQQANLANLINLNINTTTGGNFGVTVDPSISVENLKKIISKKLKVAKDRICLLHREKELQDGTLKDNNLMDGSRIILIPNVETGLLAQRPENTVMQALESLNDSQVNDFLSGKTPLNLSMRLGDHMMLIQLQLSTVNPANNANIAAHHHHHHHHHHHAGHGINCPRLRSSNQRANNRSNLAMNGGQNPNHQHQHHQHHHNHHQQFNNHSQTVPANATRSSSSSISSTVTSQISTDNLPQQQQHQLPSQSNLQMQQHHQIIRLRQSLASSAATAAVSSSSSSSASSSSVIPSSGGTVTAVGTGVASSSNSRNGNQNSISTTQTSSATNSYSIQPRNPFKHSFGTVLTPGEYESLHKIVQSITGPLPSRNIPNVASHNTNSTASANAVSPTALAAGTTSSAGTSLISASSFHSVTPPNDPNLLEQSPIKSLSNLVSSPIKTTAIKNIPITSPPHTSNHSSSLATNNPSSSTPPLTAVALSASTLGSNVSVASALTSSCQQDPIAAKLTSCLCTRLNSGSSNLSNKNCIDTTTCLSRQDNSTLQIQNQSVQQFQQRNVLITSTPNIKSQILTAAIPATASATTSASISSLHKTANNPIARSKQFSRNHQSHHYQATPGASSAATISSTSTTSLIRNSSILPNIKLQNTTSTSTSTSRFSSNSNDSGFGSDDSMNSTSTITTTNSNSNDINNGPSSSSIVGSGGAAAASANATTTSSTPSGTPMDLDDTNNITMTTDTRTLAEASRNLTQTLRKLSKEVFTNKIDLSACNDDSSNLRRSNGNSGNNGSTNGNSGTGAVIESMKNHGKGIYSGTFSGTLNPALQDRYGRPKRDISTVIHILNDLLSATPQYSRGARISLETPSSSSTSSSSISSAAGAANTNVSVDGTNVHQNSRSKQISTKHHSHHSCIKCIKAAAQHQVNSQAAGSSSSSTCTYGECNGHYTASKTITRPVSYPCCLDVPIACNGTTTIHGSHNVSATNMDKNICTCRYRIHSETGEREREYTCQKCTHDMDNMKTKSKMNQIRLVMQQSKQKREARKLKGSPYGPRLSNGVVVNNTANNASDVSSNDTEMVSATEGESTKTTSTAALNNATAATTLATATSAATSEVSPNHLVEEVDTAA